MARRTCSSVVTCAPNQTCHRLLTGACLRTSGVHTGVLQSSQIVMKRASVANSGAELKYNFLTL
ncbi:MAG: hypothetical protein AAFW82_01840, partial [Pseudomonadota bacterium]